LCQAADVPCEGSSIDPNFAADPLSLRIRVGGLMSLADSFDGFKEQNSMKNFLHEFLKIPENLVTLIQGVNVVPSKDGGASVDLQI
jgi:hypothetical protein